MHGLFLHCRPGFESECASEIQARAAALDVSGYCKAKTGAAYAVFVTTDGADAEKLHLSLPFTELIFTRQWFRILALANDLQITDRISGLVAACGTDSQRADELVLETADTNEGKELQALCRKIERPLRSALISAVHLQQTDTHPTRRLHVCFMSTTAAYVGIADCVNSSPYPMGIPRLRFPGGAPSRSTLKLEEALLTFLSPDERASELRSGMRAVDLGAAPGGWTWQLLQRGMQVIAVDNGAMAPALLESGLVEHRREDGFHFRPETPVDWMVCDIVEQPIRIAELASRWLCDGWCRRTVFNLKLPMKKRYQEVMLCLERVEQHLTQAGLGYRLACKQLYHDREEVTVFVSLQ